METLETTARIARYCATVPKAELHVHLEGSIQPTTLFALAHRNGVDLPVQTVEEMQRWFTFRDFNHFVDIFFAISRCLKTAEDYELIAYEFGATLARQQVRYAEAIFSPGMHAFSLGVPFDTFFAGLTRGRLRAQSEFGIDIRWVFDIVRAIPDETHNRQRAEYTLAVAKEGMNDGVVALGLGGAEVGHPPNQYASCFVDYLREHGIPLELCPTSNICLGVYTDMRKHPLPRLHAAGIPVTVNSDDPPLFNTTLTHEVGLLFDAFNFDINIVNDILLNGVRHSFLPIEQKQAMEASFQAEMTRLQQELAL